MVNLRTPKSLKPKKQKGLFVKDGSSPAGVTEVLEVTLEEDMGKEPGSDGLEKEGQNNDPEGEESKDIIEPETEAKEPGTSDIPAHKNPVDEKDGFKKPMVPGPMKTANPLPSTVIQEKQDDQDENNPEFSDDQDQEDLEFSDEEGDQKGPEQILNSEPWQNERSKTNLINQNAGETKDQKENQSMQLSLGVSSTPTRKMVKARRRRSSDRQNGPKDEEEASGHWDRGEYELTKVTKKNLVW